MDKKATAAVSSFALLTPAPVLGSTPDSGQKPDLKHVAPLPTLSQLAESAMLISEEPVCPYGALRTGAWPMPVAYLSNQSGSLQMCHSGACRL